MVKEDEVDGCCGYVEVDSLLGLSPPDAIHCNVDKHLKGNQTLGLKQIQGAWIGIHPT